MTFGYLATSCDPVNPEIPLRLEPASFECDSSRIFCCICQLLVSADSKHCSRCNKCIEHFDHHCKWLNNCIGKKNYRKFIILIISLELLMGNIVFFTMYKLLANIDSSDLVFIANIVTCVVSVICVIMVGYLIGFHIYLRLRGLTTYGLIILKRKPKKINRIYVETEPQLKPETQLETVLNTYRAAYQS